MNITELTTVIASLAAVVFSLIIPFVYKVIEKRRKLAGEEVVSWEKMNLRLEKERNELRKELDESEKECKDKIKSVQADFDSQISVAKERMAALEKERLALRAELADLYIELRTRETKK